MVAVCNGSSYAAVSALLHAVAVVKAGVFCILRIVCYVFGPGSVSWCGGGVLLSFLAAGTIVISSLIAMRQDHLKARLAYSTIGQLSYIVLGICILTPYSITGALFHMTAHAFLKITLFMCAGAIYVTTGISQISEMRGGARSMPCTMLCFTIASFGIAGLPLMAGFVSKMDLMRGAMAMGLPFFLFLMVGAGLLAIGYLLPVIQIAYRVNDSAADMGTASVKEAAPAMLIPLVITGMGSVLLGVVPDVGLHLYALAQLAAEAVTQGGGMFVT